jgi:hypothetical protein
VPVQKSKSWTLDSLEASMLIAAGYGEKRADSALYRFSPSHGDQGTRQTILPSYDPARNDSSVCVTTHVPYFVSIVSPTVGSRGSSTASTSFQVGASISTMNRLMCDMMQDA